jgi:hypothetical protein
LFVLTLPAVTARLYSSDEVQYFSYLRSLWFDRDVAFDNEYRYFHDAGVARTDGFRETFLEPITPTGKRENFGTLGCAILWAPFYGAADAVTRVLHATGASLPADGYSRLYIAAVAYGSAIYAFLALLLSIAAARGLTGTGVLAGLAVWFGTPLLFYMYAAPPFSHACSAFAVALFVTVWLRVREHWTARGLVLLGGSAALMTMVREQDVFYAVGPAADWALSTLAVHPSSATRASGSPSETPGSAIRESGSEIRDSDSGIRAQRYARIAAATAGVAAFVLAYTPQLLAYWSLNGRLGPSRLVTRKMTWTAPHALGVLASPQHGLFVWTPLAALAVAGLVMLAVGWRADHTRMPRAVMPVGHQCRVARCLLLMFALQVYVSGSVESWTVAGAFGQRRFVGATVLLVIGLATLCRAIPSGVPRIATGVVAMLAIWWNVGLMVLFGAGLMDRQRLNLRQNAYDVFVTLPRTAPALVYRYFAQRESFYKSPAGNGRQQAPAP